MSKGKRLVEGVFDNTEDLVYEDTHAMKLPHYVMAERCLQTEQANIYNQYKEGEYDTLTYILEGGFKGFHNMELHELIKEYDDMEDKWYQMYSDGELYTTVLEDDPINELEKDETGEVANG